MTILRSGRPVVLTAHEFKLLKFLPMNAERVLTREVLLNEVWGYNFYPTTRTVDNQILKLRQKLEPDPANPKHLGDNLWRGLQICPLKIRSHVNAIFALAGDWHESRGASLGV